MRLRFYFALLLFVVSAHPTYAQTVLDKARRDEIARVPGDDADMAAAFRKAKATLPEFLELARAPRSTITSMALKVPVRDSSETEYFWITPFIEKDGGLIGRINNTPRTVHNVKEGQVIKFGRDDVVDWLYRENGRMYGNYTACVLLKSEPPDEVEAFKKQFGLICE